MSTPFTLATDRDTYHHGDLRAALLREARRVVEANGEAGLSLRATARAVGVDPSAAYRHFRSKADVVGALAAEGFDELGLRVMRATKAVGPDPARAERWLVAAGRAYVRFGLAHPRLYRLMFGASARPEAIRAAGRPNAPDAYAALTAGLDRMVALGDLDPSARAGGELLLWSSLHGLVSLLIDERAGVVGSRGERLGARAVRVVVAGLRR